MPIPDYQTLMLPLMKALADGRPHSLSELRDGVAKRLGVTDEEREELLPSGKQAIYDNRFGWGKTYLAKAGLLTTIQRGVCQITERGRSVLSSKPARIDATLLAKFPEFEEFAKKKPDLNGGLSEPPLIEPNGPNGSTVTPQEALDSAYQQLRREIEAELLSAVKAASFRFFERLVVELLVKMGYGGSLKDAGKAIGRSGDEGLDGIIKEDLLGLDAIYVQAKRWRSNVGRPDVQAFAGSLEGVRGRKGVFITTSSFTAEAQEYVSRIEKN